MSNQIRYPLLDRSPGSGIALEPALQRADTKKLMVVVDQHEFTRGCLTSWVKAFCHEFELSSVADVTSSSAAPALAQAVVVIFHASNLMLADNWLNSQVAWLRASRPEVPVVAIVDSEKGRSIAELVPRLRLQGYIPTSSSMEVAAAVLRLVAAGGTYVPHSQECETPPLAAGELGRALASTGVAGRVDGLTPREREVLELLERGMSNKIIAYRLSLSQSTVKAHVHNIISKLKVHNRTEAAFASYSLQQATAK